jgi:hypothetical protein
MIRIALKSTALFVLVSVLATTLWYMNGCCGPKTAAVERSPRLEPTTRPAALPPGRDVSELPTSMSPAPATEELLVGEWVGRWRSTRRDDGGKLLADIRRDEQGRYLATFTANYKLMGIPGVQTYPDVVLVLTERQPGLWEFRGKKDLGFFSGGMYTFQGQVNRDELVTGYDSKFDTGVFELAPAEDTDQP